MYSFESQKKSHRHKVEQADLQAQYHGRLTLFVQFIAKLLANSLLERNLPAFCICSIKTVVLSSSLQSIYQARIAGS